MKIKCAAIRTKAGQIFEGKNHGVCYQALKQAEVPRLDSRNCKQGFVTDKGGFVDRYKAAEIAFAAGQTKKLCSPLFSEDLTGDWCWKKEKNDNKIIEGLSILAGELLPTGWVWTNDKGRDEEHCRQMVKWLNETEENPHIQTVEGGIYYGYATAMAKRIKTMIIQELAKGKNGKDGTTEARK